MPCARARRQRHLPLPARRVAGSIRSARLSEDSLSKLGSEQSVYPDVPRGALIVSRNWRMLDFKEAVRRTPGTSAACTLPGLPGSIKMDLRRRLMAANVSGFQV